VNAFIFQRLKHLEDEAYPLTHGAAILVYVKITRPHDVPIVEAVGLRKTYGAGRARLQALRDVTVSVRRGEMVAIVGPSGCGKTTLLNVLSGLDEPDAGEVRVDGTPLHEMTDRGRTAYRARHLGFIFQSYNLMPVLSAQENVELPLLVRGCAGGRRAAVRATPWQPLA
jgi:putative ABC transport system ATP-binding protein